MDPSIGGEMTPRDASTLYDGWLKILRVSLGQGPDGRPVEREVECHGDAVAVLPYDPERRIVLLLRQPRAPALLALGDPMLLEAPAGMLDGDERPEDAARREAMEEAGLALGELEPVGVFFSSPGVSTERIHLFLAPYRASMRTGDGGGLAGEGERIETCETPVAALRAAGGTVELRDLKTAYLVERLRLLRPQLFAPEP